MSSRVWIAVLLAVAALVGDDAAARQTPPALTGSVSEYRLVSGDTLTAVGAKFGVDAATLAADNRLALTSRLSVGTILRVDNRHIVPRLQSALTINVPQRLLFVDSGDAVRAFPVAVGKAGWKTPTGAFTIVAKQYRPTWHVPPSIQAEMRRAGQNVVSVVPPGPDNPLGEYWLRLSLAGIGIHSTNRPASIYQFSTHGCIRLGPADAASVFAATELGTRGEVIYEPVLMTRVDDRVFVEVHPDVYRKGVKASTLDVMAEQLDVMNLIDWSKARDVVRTHAGLARDVTKD